MMKRLKFTRATAFLMALLMVGQSPASCLTTISAADTRGYQQSMEEGVNSGKSDVVEIDGDLTGPMNQETNLSDGQDTVSDNEPVIEDSSLIQNQTPNSEDLSPLFTGDEEPSGSRDDVLGEEDIMPIPSDDEDLSAEKDMTENGTFSISGSLQYNNEQGWENVVRPNPFRAGFVVYAYSKEHPDIPIPCTLQNDNPGGLFYFGGLAHDGEGGGSYEFKNIPAYISMDGMSEHKIAIDHYTIQAGDTYRYTTEVSTVNVPDTDNAKILNQIVPLTMNEKEIHVKKVIPGVTGDDTSFKVSAKVSYSEAQTGETVKSKDISIKQTQGDNTGTSLIVPENTYISLSEEANPAYKYLKTEVTALELDENGDVKADAEGSTTTLTAENPAVCIEEDKSYVFTVYNASKNTDNNITINWVDNRATEKRNPQVSLWCTVKGESGEKEPVEITNDNCKEILGIDSLPQMYEDKGASTWTLGYKGLPAASDDGSEIYSYELRQETEGYICEKTSDGYKNTLATDFSASVIWYDSNGKGEHRPSIGQMVGNYHLYRYVNGNYEEVKGENGSSVLSFDEDGNTWNISNTVPLPAYDEKNGRYTYLIVEGEIDETTGTVISQNPVPVQNNGEHSVAYTTKYYNGTGSFGNVTDRCYNGQTIYHTIQETVDFKATKKWQDDDGEARPGAVVTLWRYSIKPGSDKTKPSALTDAAKVVVKNGDKEVLLSYTLATSQIVSSADNDEETIDFLNGNVQGLPADFSLPKFDENGNEYYYFVRETLAEDGKYEVSYPKSGVGFGAENGGVVANKRTENGVVHVNKVWVSPSEINDYKNSSVTVDLIVQNEDGTYETVQAVENMGSQNITLSGSGSNSNYTEFVVPLYDENGHAFNYAGIKESAISNADEGTISYDETGIICTFEINGHHYKGSSTQGDNSKNYAFDSEGMTQLNFNVRNAIVDPVDYTIVKHWGAGVTKSDLEFKLSAVNAMGSKVTTVDGTEITTTYEMQLDTALNNQDAGTQTYVIQNLPKYDDNGYLIQYKATEQVTEATNLAQQEPNKKWSTIHEYSQYQTDVYNNPWDKPSYYIYVQKQWVDGGDSSNRKPVTIHVCMEKDGDVIDLASEAGKDYQVMDDKTYTYEVQLSAGNVWEKRINVPFNPEEINYSIKEVSITNEEGNQATSTGTSASGNDLFDTGLNTYEASYSRVGDDTFVVTNKKTGYVNVQIDKNWKDGNNSDGNRPASIDFIIYQNKKPYTGPVTVGTEDDEQDLTVNNGLVTLTPPTGTTLSNQWTKTFKNLPKFDENGNLYTYSVTENTEWMKDNKYADYVSIQTREAYGNNTYQYAYENSRTGKTDFSIYKVWNDRATGGSNRPDLYLTLYRTTSTEQFANGDIYTDYKDQLWTPNNGEDVYNWKITIPNLPKYDNNGAQYIYYMVEKMNNDGVSGDSRYRAHYCSGSATSADHNASGVGEKAYEGEYIVNTLYDEMTLSGEKTWVNTDGYSTDELPSPQIDLYRYLASEKSADQLTKDDRIDSITLNKDYGKGDKSGYTFPTKNCKGVIETVGEDSNVVYTLPKYAENGERYTYLVKETIPSQTEGISVYTNVNQNNSLTNTFDITKNVRDIKVTKNWARTVDGELSDKENIAYPSVTYTLYRYKKPADGKVWSHDQIISTAENMGTQTITPSEFKDSAQDNNSASAVFKNQLIYSPDGTQYYYYVVEKGIKGYTIAYSYTGQDRNSVTSTDGAHITDCPAMKSSDSQANPVSEVESTNSYNQKGELTVSGEKSWKDYNNAYGYRPDSIDVVLYRYTQQEGAYGNQVQKEPVTLITDKTTKEELNNQPGIIWNKTANASTTEKWSYTIYNLDKYAPNGLSYIYCLCEQPVNFYNIGTDGQAKGQETAGKSASAAQTEITLNTLTNNLSGTYTVKKVWIDGENKYGFRPDSITVQLQKTTTPDDPNSWVNVTNAVVTPKKTNASETISNGSYEMTAEDDAVPKTNDCTWSATFSNLPVYAKNSDGTLGAKYTYRCVETKIGNLSYSTDVSANEDDNKKGAYTRNYDSMTDKETQIRNSMITTKLQVTKKWDDESNLYQTRPTLVKFKLQRAVHDTNRNQYTDWTWEDAVDSKGNPITITLDRADCLLADPNTWVKSFENLPVCGENAEGTFSLYYRAVEVVENKSYEDISDYSNNADSSYWTYNTTDNQNEVVVKNHMIPKAGSKVDLTIAKQWVNDTDASDFDAVFELKRSKSADGTYESFTTPIKVTMDKFTKETKTTDDSKPSVYRYTFKNLPKFDSDETEWFYKVVETPNPDTHIQIATTSVSANNLATIDSVQNIKLQTLTVTKNWTDYSNAYSVRPTSLESNLTLYFTDKASPSDSDWMKVSDATAEGSTNTYAAYFGKYSFDKSETSNSNAWTYTYAGLPKYVIKSDGTKALLKYKIVETENDNYICSYGDNSQVISAATDSQGTAVQKTITNTLVHGYVNLKKVSAEDKDATTVAMKDVEFEIYKKGETSPYVTVKTDANGNLIKNTDGTYGTGDAAKYLIPGTYVLNEKTTNTSHSISSELSTGIEFTVSKVYNDGTKGAGGTGDQGTAWISFCKENDTTSAADKKAPADKVSYVEKDNTATDAQINKVINNTIRGTAAFTKVDGNSVALTATDGYFEVYTDAECTTAVASMKIDSTTGSATKGKYILSNVNITSSGASSFTENRSDGIPYLWTKTANSVTSVYLLSGTYYIKEIEAPSGYVIDPVVRKLVISGTDGYSNAGKIGAKDAAESALLDDYKWVNTSNQLTIYKYDQYGNKVALTDSNYLTLKAENGKTFANSSLNEVRLYQIAGGAVTDKDGKAIKDVDKLDISYDADNGYWSFDHVFTKNVKYTLSEGTSQTPSEYFTASSVSFTYNADGTITLNSGADVADANGVCVSVGKDEAKAFKSLYTSSATGNQINLRDIRRYAHASVTKISSADGNPEVANISFKLYKCVGTAADLTSDSKDIAILEDSVYLTSDENGKIDTNSAICGEYLNKDTGALLKYGLTSGTYYLIEQELGAADQYTVITDPIYFKVSANSSVSTFNATSATGAGFAKDGTTGWSSRTSASEIVNTPLTASKKSLNLTKLNQENNSEKVAGATFKLSYTSITNTQDGSTNTSEITCMTDANGVLRVVGTDNKITTNAPDISNKGTYVLKETSPAPGYTLDSTGFQVTFTVSNTSTGDLTINKDATDTTKEGYSNFSCVANKGAVLVTDAGVVNRKNHVTLSKITGDATVLNPAGTNDIFSIVPNDTTKDSFADGTKTAKTFKPTASAIAELVGVLKAGSSYKISEINPPYGYKKANDVVVTMAVDGKLTISGTNTPASVTQSTDTDGILTNALTIKDEPLSAKVIKKNAKGIVLPGAEYELSGNFAKGTDGAAKTTSAVVFTLKAADGTITLNDTTLVKASVKSGGDTATSSYRLLASRTVNGTTTEYVYTLKETKAPAGYTKDANEYKFTIDESGKVTLKSDGAGTNVSVDTTNTDTLIFKNTENKMTINKTDMSSTPVTLSGALFSVTGKFADTKGNVADSGTTIGNIPSNALATALTGKLVATTNKTTSAQEGKDQFTYTLKETHPANGYVPASDVKFRVAEDGSIYFVDDVSSYASVSAAQEGGPKQTVTIKDESVKLNIVKTNEDGTAKLEGVEFTLKDKDTSSDKVHFAGLSAGANELKVTTDENGKIDCSSKLIAGHTYTIEETTAKDTYISRAGEILAEISVSNLGVPSANNVKGYVTAVAAATNYQLTLTIKNKVTKIYVTKVSNQTGESGEDLKPPYGATLSVYEWDTNAQKKANSSAVGTVTTSTTAGCELSISALKENQVYSIEETTTPFGFETAQPVYFKVCGVVNAGVSANSYETGSSKIVLVDKAGNEKTYDAKECSLAKSEDGTTVSIHITDDEVKVPVSLHKVKLSTDSTGNATRTSIKGAEFNVYPLDDSNNKVEAGKLVAVTDADGMLVLKGDKGATSPLVLKAGNYTAVETSVPADVYYDKTNPVTINFTVTEADYTAYKKNNALVKNVASDKMVLKDTLKESTSNSDDAQCTDNDAFKATIILTKYDNEDTSTTKAGIKDTKFTLYEQTGVDPKNPVWSIVGSKDQYITDKDGKLSIPVDHKGTFKVVETTAASGYVLPESPYDSGAISVTDTQYSATDLLSSKVPNTRKTGTLIIHKTDGDVTDTTKQALDGVTFKLYKKDETATIAEKTWNFIQNLITGKDSSYKVYTDVSQKNAVSGQVKIDGLEWGKYYIVEETENDGYVLKSDKYYFEVNAITVEKPIELFASETMDKDGKITDNVITNYKNRFTFIKTDAAGKQIAGGTYEILGSDNKPVKFYTLDSAVEKAKETSFTAVEAATGTVIYGLKKGSYKLHEITAPNGYLLSSDIAFSIDAEGKISAGTGNDTLAVVDKTSNTIKMADHQIEIGLEKIGSESTKQNKVVLSGAKFSIKGSFVGTTDTEIKDLTVDTFRSALKGKLIATKDGAADKDKHIYTLTETLAPNGYARHTESISFTVSPTGNITLINAADLGFVTTISQNSTNGNVASVQMQDTPISISFVKKAFAETVDGKPVEKPLKGAKFTLTDVTKDVGSYYAKTAVDGAVIDGNKCTLTTKEDGTASISGVLLSGHTYNVTESVTPDGYISRSNDVIATITVSADGVVSATKTAGDTSVQIVNGNAGNETTVVNTSVDITVKNKKTEFIIKKSDNQTTPKKVSGATISIYEKGKDTVIASFTTDNVEANVNRITALKEDVVYVAKETTTPFGYETASPVYFKLSGSVASGQENTNEKYAVSGSKIVLCDEKGTEITSPSEAVLSTTTIDTDVSVMCITMTDDVIKVPVSIKKIRVDGDEKAALKDAKFSIYKLEAAEGVEETKVEDFEIKAVTNADGMLVRVNADNTVEQIVLDEGKYLLVETSTPSNTYCDKGEYTFTVTEAKYTAFKNDGTLVLNVASDKLVKKTDLQSSETTSGDAKAISNDAFTATITLQKVDADSSKKAAIKNTEFTLYEKQVNADSTVNWNKISTLTTDNKGNLVDADGKAVTLNHKATYKIVETKAASGYVLPAEGQRFEKEFTLSDASFKKKINLGKDKADDVSGIGTVPNTRKTGTIHIIKVDDGTGEGLNNVAFALYKKDETDNVFKKLWNFITGNKYAYGEAISAPTKLSADGTAVITGITWGQYYIAEIEAGTDGEGNVTNTNKGNDGYVLKTDKYYFTVDAQTVESELLFKDADGKIVSLKESDIDNTSTNSGTVSVNEIKNKKNCVTFHKKGIDGTALSGGLFQILDADNNAVSVYLSATEKDASKKVTSFEANAEKGVSIYGLKKGSYKLKEITAPAGYMLDTTAYSFTIDEYGKITGTAGQEGFVNAADNTLTITNKPLKVSLGKRERVRTSVNGVVTYSVGTTPLTGTKATLTGVFANADGTVSGNSTTTEEFTIVNGQIAPELTAKLIATTNASGEEGVTKFTYTLTENQAPEGFELASPVTFTIGTDGKLSVANAFTNTMTEDQALACYSAYDADNNTLLLLDKAGRFMLRKEDAADNTIAMTDTWFKLTDVTKNATAHFATENITESEDVKYVDNGKSIVVKVNVRGNITISGFLLNGHEYELYEDVTKDGYISRDDRLAIVHVSVDKAGTIKADNLASGVAGDGTVAGGTADNQLLIKNNKTVLSVRKVDDSNAYVENAGITIEKWDTAKQAVAEGTTPVTFTTAKADHTVYGLSEDQVYRLTETTRPNGYETADPVYFKLSQSLTGEGLTYVNAGSKVTLVNADGSNKADTDGIMIPNTLDGQSIITLKVTDDVISVPVSLLKVRKAKDGSVKALKDAEFTISVADDKYAVKTGAKTYLAVTDENGILVSKATKEKIMLKEGYYVITETSAPLDTYCDGRSYKFHVTEADYTAYKKTGKETTKNALVKNIVTDDANIKAGKETTADNKAPSMEKRSSLLAASAVTDAKVNKAVNNEFNAVISLEKYDTTSNAGIKDTQFTLWYKAKSTDEYSVYKSEEGTALGIQTTDENGILTATVSDKGFYKLMETQPASGYHMTDPVFTKEFEVKDSNYFDNTENHKTKIDFGKVGNTRKTATIVIIKKDADTLEGMNDVSFALYKKDESRNIFENIWNFITGGKYSYKLDDRANVDEDGRTEIKDIEWGSYYIVEEQAGDGHKGNDGYVLTSDKYYFTVDAQTVESRIVLYKDADGKLKVDQANAENTPAENVIYNKKNQFTFVKKEKASASGQGAANLFGGSYQVLNKDKTPVKVWLDSKKTTQADAVEYFEAKADGVTIYGLPEGTYYIHECIAPYGYKLSEDVEFFVAADGKIYKSKAASEKQNPTSQDMWKETASAQSSWKVVMTDNPIAIAISKHNSEETDRQLKDSEFSVTGVFADHANMTLSKTISGISPDDFTKELTGKLIATHNTGDDAVEGTDQFTYELRETKAPVGYKLHTETVKFRISQDGEVILVSKEYEMSSQTDNTDTQTEGFVTVNNKQNVPTISVYDDPIYVSVTVKKDFVGEEQWAEGMRPKQIDVQLYRSTDEEGTNKEAVGEVVTINENTNPEKNFTYTWNELRESEDVLLQSDTYKPTTYIYTVEEPQTKNNEVMLKLYDASQTFTIDAKTKDVSINLTNTLKEDEFSKTGYLQITKTNHLGSIYEKFNVTVDLYYENDGKKEYVGPFTGKYLLYEYDKAAKSYKAPVEKETTANDHYLSLSGSDYIIAEIPNKMTYEVQEVFTKAQVSEEEKLQRYVVSYTGEKGTIKAGDDEKEKLKNKADTQIVNDAVIYTAIQNTTINEADAYQNRDENKKPTNLGGTVTIVNNINNGKGESDKDKVDYDANKLVISWKPDTNWNHDKSQFVVNYLEYDDYGHTDGIMKQIVVKNYLNKDGSLKDKSDSCYDELRNRYSDFDIKMLDDGTIVLSLADNVKSMPYLNCVEVKFLPTLAVENTTKKNANGKVKVDGGKFSADSDGKPGDGNLRYEKNIVYAVADKNCYIDLKNLQIGPVDSVTKGVDDNKKANILKLDKKNRFTTTVEYKGQNYTIKGKVTVLAKDEKNRPTKISIEIDDLLVPLDIGIPFLSGGVSDTPNKPDDTPSPDQNVPQAPSDQTSASQTNVTAVKTGDETPLNLWIFMAIAGLMGTISSSVFRKKRKEE